MLLPAEGKVSTVGLQKKFLIEGNALKLLAGMFDRTMASLSLEEKNHQCATNNLLSIF
jgi:hypothetical protein